MPNEQPPISQPGGERSPITDGDRAVAAGWLEEYLANPENMDLVRTRIRQQAEIGVPGAPALIIFGSRTGGGYSTTVAITEAGLQEISEKQRSAYSTQPAAATIEPTDTQRAVHYFEHYGKGNPRNLPDWLDQQLADIEYRYSRLHRQGRI